MKLDLDGRGAIVTGGARGIGRAIAETLGSAGATVIGTATRESGAEAISAYFAERGIKGQGLALNVTNPDTINTVIATIVADYGPVGILINNAGITKDNLLMRMKEEEWDQIIDTNLTSVYRTSKACLRGMMKARKGRIICISSVIGSSGNPGQTNYSAAKAGLIGFSKSLAQEVGSRGITVNVVSPGFIDTDMTRELPESQRESLLGHIPLNRLGQAKEVASAVLFLATDMGGYVTDETIHVNGGMYMS